MLLDCGTQTAGNAAVDGRRGEPPAASRSTETDPPCAKCQKQKSGGSTPAYTPHATTIARHVPLHIELADWGDVLLIAPLSANTMAKLALGLCDNLVSRIFRCWEPPKVVVVAPAMNTKMWEHAVTARHLEELQGFGAAVVFPVSKTLACGDVLSLIHI